MKNAIKQKAERRRSAKILPVFGFSDKEDTQPTTMKRDVLLSLTSDSRSFHVVVRGESLSVFGDASYRVGIDCTVLGGFIEERSGGRIAYLDPFAAAGFAEYTESYPAGRFFPADLNTVLGIFEAGCRRCGDKGAFPARGPESADVLSLSVHRANGVLVHFATLDFRVSITEGACIADLAPAFACVDKHAVFSGARDLAPCQLCAVVDVFELCYDRSGCIGDRFADRIIIGNIGA